jgi:hypothetical protein
LPLNFFGFFRVGLVCGMVRKCNSREEINLMLNSSQWS